MADYFAIGSFLFFNCITLLDLGKIFKVMNRNLN